MLIERARRSGFKFARILAGFTALVLTVPALAANYPLELISPRSAGTAPPTAGASAIGGSHRIFKAYPGLEYNIRAVVIGGAYPYSFSLSNAPAGMTIDSSSGEIEWPSPQNDATPTIAIVDAEGTRVSSSWTIDVTTTGFHFVDAQNGRAHPTGNGTVGNPWRTISDIVRAPAAAGGDIVYFRSGTYNVLDLPRESSGSPWERVSFSSTEKPTAWLAYPGSTPIIDFGHVPGGETGPIIRFEGNHVYIDGFETRRSHIIGFQATSGSNSHYKVFRRLRMRDHNVAGENLDGTNAAFIMTTSSYQDSAQGGNENTWAKYLAIQDCEFLDSNEVAIKIYSQWKMVIEDNIFRNTFDGAALKSDVPRFTYRGNGHFNVRNLAIGGNMHSVQTSGEILFNLVNLPSAQLTLDLNQDGQARRVDIYRNTFVGDVLVRNVTSANGPFRVYNNVIVNNESGSPAGSHITRENVADASRVNVFDNLTGFPNDNIVDGNGNLTADFDQYIGSRGHQLGDPVSPPSPPSDVVIE